jgi:hypothetical protein
MNILRSAPEIERKGEISSLVLWLCEPFDPEFSFRPPLAQMEKRLMGVLELPAEEPEEDFVEGRLTWGQKVFSLYFERSLGYAEFSSPSHDDVEALLDALTSKISVRPSSTDC